MASRKNQHVSSWETGFIFDNEWQLNTIFWRIDQFFIAKNITEKPQKSHLIEFLFSLLCNLVAPGKPSDKNYHELIAVMNDHQNLKPSVIVERYKFNKRDRQIGESIPFYLTELKRLSEHCDFSFSMDTVIGDSLVCGVRNTKV